MSIYTLTERQIEFIIENFFEFSLDLEDKSPDKALFEHFSHPAELFYLAYIYDLDDGVEVLQWVIDSPLCCKATASLVFWLAEPNDYRRYQLPEDSSASAFEAKVLALLHSIIQKYENNDFNDIALSFDPTSELEPFTETDVKWEIPAALFEKLEGLEVHGPVTL